MWSVGIWKPMDRKFRLLLWLRKSITTRCGSMLSSGMRLPRKSRVNTRTLHARVLWVLCDLMKYCVMACMPCCMCFVKCCVLGD